MKKNVLLSIADAVFAGAAFTALMISRFDPNQRLFWVGVGLGAVAIVNAFLLRKASKVRRKEIVLEIDPLDWTVKKEDGMAMRAWLDIPPERHGKGSDINVRIEQVEHKKWDLDEPQIKDGKVTIRYSSNNFPMIQE